MKKFVKIISVVMCALLLVTGFFFGPKNMTPYLLNSHAATTQADTRAIGQTYDYDAELLTEYTGFGNFAIDSIESLSIQGTYLLSFECTFSNAYSYIFGFLSSDYFTSAQYFDYFVVNGSGFNMLVKCLNGSIALESKSSVTVNGTSYYKLNAFNMSANSRFKFYFSPSIFNLDSEGEPVLGYSNLYFSTSDLEQFSSVVDMDSLSNYSTFFDFSFSSIDDPISEIILNFINNSQSSSLSIDDFLFYSSSYTITCYSYKSSSGSRIYNIFGYCRLYLYIDRSTIVQKLEISSLYFVVYRPVYRVNNSLIFYNYDYLGFTSHLKSLSYTLSRGDYPNISYYNINYESSLPNYKYLQFYNSSINNIVFDVYIDVDFDFDDYFIDVSSSDYVSSGSFHVPFNLGFDFNFSYYTNPLISSSGIYNYEFEKPGYVDMEFSLYPFHIPVLEAVENAMIFLLFYCPITSDIIELLHFDKFLGGLIQIFNIFIDSQIGDFIMGAFAFLILWGILSSLLPKALSSARSIYSNSQFVYNRRRKREDKQKLKLSVREGRYNSKKVKRFVKGQKQISDWKNKVDTYYD